MQNVGSVFAPSERKKKSEVTYLGATQSLRVRKTRASRPFLTITAYGAWRSQKQNRYCKTLGQRTAKQEEKSVSHTPGGDIVLAGEEDASQQAVLNQHCLWDAERSNIEQVLQNVGSALAHGKEKKTERTWGDIVLAGEEDASQQAVLNHHCLWGVERSNIE